MINELLFTEKYRPKNLSEVLLPNRIKEKFKEGVYQNFLFEGPAGTGKTSLAKALCEEFDHDYLYINASSERSIEVVRSEITDYCTNMSILDGERKIKIVILDEVDGAGDAFFKALRATMEKFNKTSRFILTCNYINKVPEPIQSRCETIKFDFTDDEEKELFKSYFIRSREIAKIEGLNIKDRALAFLVKRLYPDMRRVIVYIQSLVREGKEEYTEEDIKKFHGVYTDLYKSLTGPQPDPIKNYKLIAEQYSNRIEDVMTALGSEFISYLETNNPEKSMKVPMIIIKVAEYQSKRNQVIDPFVSLLALVYEIQIILNT